MMETLISDLKTRGLSSAGAVVNHYRDANLIDDECAANVRKLLRAEQPSHEFDISQLHQILEAVSREGNISTDILISEITSTTKLANNKSEVITAYYSWKRSPLGRMLNSFTPKSKDTSEVHETISEVPEVSEVTAVQEKEEKKKHKRNPPSSKPKKQASPEVSDAEENEYNCHGGYCATASEDTMSECDVPKYPEIDTELPTADQLMKASRERIEAIRKQHELEKYDALSATQRLHHTPPVDKWAMEQREKSPSYSSISYNVSSVSEDDF